MPETTFEERVKLCAARSLGLAENLNDATVLIDSLVENGVIDIEIPGQSSMVSISGDEFIRNLTKAVTQFQDLGDWIDLEYADVEQAGGSVNLPTNDGDGTIFYRIVNEDGTLPDPPVISRTGDRMVVFHHANGG